VTIENALKAARSAGKRTVLLRLKSGDAMRFLTAPAAEAANVGGRISTLTRKDVTAMFGKLDDVVIAKIIATGPTPEELEEAHAWPANDEPMMNAGHPLSERPRCSRCRYRRRHQRRGRAGRHRKA